MTEITRHSTAILATLIAGVAFAGLSGCSKETADRQVMKVGQLLPEEHPTTQAMVFFKERVEALSEGRIEVRLFTNGQLGDANELIAGCQIGNIEAAVVSAAPLAQHVADLNVLVMPFIFRDAAHCYAVLDGPVGETIRERIADVNLQAAAYFDAGTRNVMTKTGPVKTPADLAGKKIRVMDSNALREAVERLGASAIPMSQGEVYGALQTGVIDGWENNASTCLNFSMYETGCKYFAWTRHVAIADVLIISAQWRDKLDEPLRQAVDRAARETRDHQRKLWKENEKEAVTRLEAAGMLFNEVDHDAFAQRFVGFHDAFVDRYGESFGKLLNQIQASAGDENHP